MRIDSSIVENVTLDCDSFDIQPCSMPSWKRAHRMQRAVLSLAYNVAMWSLRSICYVVIPRSELK